MSTTCEIVHSFISDNNVQRPFRLCWRCDVAAAAAVAAVYVVAILYPFRFSMQTKGYTE